MKRRLVIGFVLLGPVLCGGGACAGAAGETGGPEAAPDAPATAPAGGVPGGAEAGTPKAAPPATTRPRADASPPAGSQADFERTLSAADRRIDELVRLGGATDEASVRRRDLVESAIEAFATEYVDRLLAGAADASDPVRRCTCIKALAFANDRRATPVAVAALRDSGDTAIQTAAGFALARLGDPDTDVAVLVAAVRSTDVDVRVNALVALTRVLDGRGAIGNFLDVRTRDQVLPALETALFDPEDPAVRGRAAATARALDDPRVVPSLVNLLRDKHPFVRAQTALALGQYGDRGEVLALVEVIDDTPVGPARTAVIDAITRIVKRARIEVPRDLPDEQAAWSDFVRRAYAEQDRRPLR
jgi:HEAT repeat protein